MPGRWSIEGLTRWLSLGRRQCPVPLAASEHERGDEEPFVSILRRLHFLRKENDW